MITIVNLLCKVYCFFYGLVFYLTQRKVTRITKRLIEHMQVFILSVLSIELLNNMLNN